MSWVKALKALAGFATSRAGRWVILALAVVGVALWLRWDAVRDAMDGIEAESNESRLEHREDAEKEKSDVDQVDPDDLLRELIERLSRPGGN